MVYFIIVVLGVSVLLYTLLGGADFGAGIVESFSGKKGINTISKAIAPIWEANHIWLILAVVIVFNGFPEIYAVMSIYLHIPLMVVLTGIIFRGVAFTFRYYDVLQDNTGNIYTIFFRVSSFLTSFFLGVNLGAMTTGKIPANHEGMTFYLAYIQPWLNPYSLALGLFTMLIFGTLAGVYLIGEAKDEQEKKLFIKISRNLFVALIISGGIVFLSAELNEVPLFQNYSDHIVSIICVVLATLGIPFTFKAISGGRTVLSRIMVGFQVLLVVLGYIISFYPNLIYLHDGSSLTYFNTAAPLPTLRQLTNALIVGVLIILPSLFFLYKVFKLDDVKK